MVPASALAHPVSAVVTVAVAVMSSQPSPFPSSTFYFSVYFMADTAVGRTRGVTRGRSGISGMRPGPGISPRVGPRTGPSAVLITAAPTSNVYCERFLDDIRSGVVEARLDITWKVDRCEGTGWDGLG